MNIKLKLTKSDNCKHYGVKKDAVITLDIEEYLRGVVPSEVSASWNVNALKAQAIAARTYAIYQTASGTKTINDTPKFQSYWYKKIDSRTDAAITATAGQVLVYNNAIINAVFSASNGGTCVSAAEHWKYSVPYLIAKKDPWTEASGYAKKGHGIGLSQRGACYAAGQLGKTYTEILYFYYSGTSIVSNYNGSSSGTYASWQAKYGNNTFVKSNKYSGNVYRFQVDMNKWRLSKGYAKISEDGLWGSGSVAATLLFQQAYGDLSNDGKAGPATKAKLFSICG